MRIAIVSPLVDESTSISITLSEKLQIPYIYTDSSNDEYQILFKKGNREKKTSHEIYTTILAQFHARIKTEKIPQFISNGTVLNNIVLKKHEMRQNNLLKRTLSYWILRGKYCQFENKVVNLIEEYAQTAYDRIYFLKNTNHIHNEYSRFFEIYMLEVMNEKKIDHKIVIGDLDSFLHDILSDINDVFFKNRSCELFNK